MNNRESIEKREYEILSPLACKAAESKGRVYEEEQCEYRTDFQRDRDRIVHSKAFRRLIHKTQVFLAPEGDHYRTRLTHTLEVSQISRTVARILAYNEDLAEAIALGHESSMWVKGPEEAGGSTEALCSTVELWTNS